MKTCGRCKIIKDLEGFPPSARLRNGAWCRSCHSTYSKDWERRNPGRSIKKVCTKCGTLKGPKRFPVRRQGGWCTDCRRSYARERGRAIAADPIRKALHEISNNSCKAALRAQAFRNLGRACACCGQPRQWSLELDHIEGGGTKHRHEVGGGLGVYRAARRESWPKSKYQMLCSTCNRGKWRNGVCPHVDERFAERMLSA